MAEFASLDRVLILGVSSYRNFFSTRNKFFVCFLIVYAILEEFSSPAYSVDMVMKDRYNS